MRAYQGIWSQTQQIRDVVKASFVCTLCNVRRFSVCYGSLKDVLHWSIRKQRIFYKKIPGMFTTQGNVQEKESFGGVERSPRLRNTKKKAKRKVKRMVRNIGSLPWSNSYDLKEKKRNLFFHLQDNTRVWRENKARRKFKSIFWNLIAKQLKTKAVYINSLHKHIRSVGFFYYIKPPAKLDY